MYPTADWKVMPDCTSSKKTINQQSVLSVSVQERRNRLRSTTNQIQLMRLARVNKPSVCKPPLQPAVFPPAIREPPPPALELFDLDEHFATEQVGLAGEGCRALHLPHGLL